MSQSVHLATNRLTAPLSVAVLGFIVFLLCFPATLVAFGFAFGFLPLPYPLFLVLQQLPIAFPLHMVASGLALVLIPIAALTRHYSVIHRAVGRLAGACVAAGGLTALSVALASEATAVARAGFFMQGLTWIALFSAAIIAIRRRERTRHARLMIAMAAVASGAIWLRLVMIGAAETKFSFETVYAAAAWACWLIPLALVFAVRLPTTLPKQKASSV